MNTSMHTDQDTDAFPKLARGHTKAEFNSGENQFVPKTNVDDNDVDFAEDLDNAELNKAHSLFGDHGIMNFTKMVEDGVLNVHKA